MAKKRKSKYESEYRKARKNYLARIRRAEKKGYILPEKWYIPLEKASKRSIERLNKTRIAGKQKSLGRLDLETGEVIKFPKGSKRPVVIDNWSDIIFKNFRFYMEMNFPESPFKQYAYEWLEQMRAEFDDDTVASTLEKAKEMGMFPTRFEMYNREQFMECLSDLTELFNFTTDQKSDILNWFEEAIDNDLMD